MKLPNGQSEAYSDEHVFVRVLNIALKNKAPLVNVLRMNVRYVQLCSKKDWNTEISFGMIPFIEILEGEIDTRTHFSFPEHWSVQVDEDLIKKLEHRPHDFLKVLCRIDPKVCCFVLYSDSNTRVVKSEIMNYPFKQEHYWWEWWWKQ